MLNRTAPPLESASLLEGERLGQFVLQKFIGGGGMGVVFRALDTTLNREVAVKVLSRDQSADEEALRRFRNEAQSAARLDHENIARVYYVGEDRGVHYIVFEFIEGINLRDRVEQNGPLPLAEAVSYHAIKSPRPWLTPASATSSTATSSRRTCSSRPTARPSWSTWAWPGLIQVAHGRTT